MTLNDIIGQLVVSPSAIEGYWRLLSPKERADIMLSDFSIACRFTELGRKDPSEFVRMLAHSPLHSVCLNQQEFQSALGDGSSLVSAAAWAHKDIAIALTNLKPEQRPTMMALRKHCSSLNLLEFIKNEIAKDESSIPDVCILLRAYCGNKSLMAIFTDPDAITDGENRYFAEKYFDAMWQFAADSPYEISEVIAWGMPTAEGNRHFRNIPKEYIKDNVEIALAWRQYKPLLERIRANPELFSTNVINEGQQGLKAARQAGIRGQAE